MRLVVLVLEDEPDVREALERDLEPLAAHVRIEPAEDVADARQVMAETAADGDLLAVVLADHRLPGSTGVDFLVEVAGAEETAHVGTVLVTGQADQADTIRAVNQGGLDYYLAKPWDPEELRRVVREQLTNVVARTRVDPLPHLAALDQVRAMELVRRRSG